jgi:hypothetical protein
MGSSQYQEVKIVKREKPIPMRYGVHEMVNRALEVESCAIEPWSRDVDFVHSMRMDLGKKPLLGLGFRERNAVGLGSG